ncbi:DedA family protein [Bordetella avium]|uniref:Membrane protein n=1 Tax=Bordetella avium (strain 197N) TaxID=360910 RepID=Q2L2L2_BORA1|nr:DedA family protein [Bordetella avium]AZY52186.1 DedA family protein [Bordetella avium]RIQ14114.1 DedA family protein [Bordetella avium]RIQ17987.1 DedA family protein [Bordetella avium]RIQ36462.1 DedA family protein [Bordetella avium]RIQ39813.1 DedA family protein [Bordetella avium]
MDSYINKIGMFIEANQEWAGPITFLLTLGESMLILGLLIPATALMLLTGGLIGAGTLPPWGILIWGIAGAVVGDALSYFIGRWLGPGITRRWPLSTQRTAVARARLFFSRYGFASVFLGRFLGPIRSTIPTVAGIMGMKHARFQLANILSAAVWLPAMLAPGYFAAKGLSAARDSQQFGLIAGALASVLLGVWLAAAMLKKRRQPARRSKP